jgi:hypothetical protein
MRVQSIAGQRHGELPTRGPLPFPSNSVRRRSEAIYAVALIVAGESILNAEPLPLIAIAGTLAVVAIGAGLLLRRFRKRRS